MLCTVGECAARTQQLLRDAARQGVSAQQLMVAALETTSCASVADTLAVTPADKQRQLLVSGCNRLGWCAHPVSTVCRALQFAVPCCSLGKGLLHGKVSICPGRMHS
jgi:hypothetical protein